MTIYIGCIQAGINGGKPTSACSWKNRHEFFLYCYEILSMRDTKVTASMSIECLCDAIQDVGFGGVGSRWYRRMHRPDAVKILN